MKWSRNLIYLLFAMLFSINTSYTQIHWDTLHLQNEMSPNYTQDITIDHENYIWISTARGLYRVDGYEARYYVHNPEDTLSLVNNIVTNVYQDNDNDLWILTDKGVQSYNHKKETFHSILGDYIEEQQDSLYKYGFQCAQQIDQEHMLFGTKDGCVLYNKINQSYKYIPILLSTSTKGYSSLAHVIEIVKSPLDSTQFYLLTKSGIYSFDRHSHRVKLIFNEPEINFASIGPPGLSMVAQKDYLYFIVRKEVYCYQISTGEYFALGMSKIPNADIVIRDILLSQDANLIISTTNNGLYQVSLEPPFQPKLVVKGLYNQMTFDPEGHLITIAETSDIVVSSDLFAPPIDPALLLKIDKLWVNNNRKLLREVFKDDVYHLRDFERNLDFKIAVNHTNPNEKFKYYYQLDDSLWEKVNDDRMLSLNNMKLGKHAIKFKAEYEKQQFYSSSLMMQIDRYFYEQWWFRILIFSTAVFLLAAIYYLVRSLKRNREQYNRQVIEMELSALRSQMNPHFLFNTLNSIKNYVLTKTPDDAAYYLTKFSQLIRSILENSKMPFLTLQQELDSIKLYVEMEHLRFGGEFDYSFQVDDSIDPLQFKIAPMLIQPFIENAIWHGLMNIKSDRVLAINFKAERNGVLCTIEDNGIGLSKSKELQLKRNQHKKSLGLNITLERIKNINILYKIEAKVKIEDRMPSGTKVTIYLPSLDKEIK